MLQSESSDEDLPLTCVADLLDRRREDEGRWGGLGPIRSLTDDNTDSGPGECEDEERTERVIRRRLLMLEETYYQKEKKGGEGEDKKWEGH